MSIERVSPKWIKVLEGDEVFVFGSNIAGQHMGGAAKIALDWGACGAREWDCLGKHTLSQLCMEALKR